VSFAHLHVHTQFSLLDGANKIGPLLEHAKGSGMEAMAITDHGNMFGAVEFYQKSIANGIKPIIGCEAYLAPGKRGDRTQAPGGDDVDGAGNFHLIVLAQNRTGLPGGSLLQAAHRQGNSRGAVRRPDRTLGVSVRRNSALAAAEPHG